MVRVGYQQTEVGIIPKDWKRKPIAKICNSIVSGRNKPKKFGGNIPWITIEDMDTFFIKKSKSNLKVSKKEINRSGGKIIPKNSVIMSCVGEFGLVGTNENEVVLNQQLHAFHCLNEITPYYLVFFLATMKKYMDTISTKTTIAYLNKDNCDSIPITYPPILEQEKIVQALLDVNVLIEKLKKTILKKNNLKKGAMQELLTGKRRLEGFELEWTKTKLGKIGKVFSGTSAPQSEKYFVNGVFPFVRVSDLAVNRRTKNLVKVQDYINEQCISIKSLVKAEKGTNVFPKSGASVGNNNRSQLGTDMYIVSHLCAIFSKDNSNDFIYYLLCMIDMLDYVGDKGYPSLKLSEIKNIEVTIPKDKGEQKEIVKIFSDMDSEIQELETKRDKYIMIKNGMIQKLLTGEIRLV
jgi:type I restriction enzyme, S subunit